MASCGTWMKSSSYDPDGNNSHPSLWEFGVLQAEQDSWSYTPALQIPKLPQAKEEIQRNVVLTARKKRGIILFSKGSAPELKLLPESLKFRLCCCSMDNPQSKCPPSLFLKCLETEELLL